MDMELDFSKLYNRQRSEPPRYKKKQTTNKKIVKKRKKSTAASNKRWDGSLSNLDSHRLCPSKQMDKKLNSVSKHRHYAKDLVQEQRQKNLQRRRLEKEEQDIEQEQKQLIRRKQMLLRRNPMPNVRRAFPVFTAGRSEYDDDDEDEEEDVTEEEQYAHDQEDDEDEDEDDDDDDGGDAEVYVSSHSNDAAVSVKALSQKLSSLEHELESMKRATGSAENGSHQIHGAEEKESQDENENDADSSFDVDRIHKTLDAVAERRTTSKALHITLPSMPSLPQPLQDARIHNNKENTAPSASAGTTDVSATDTRSLLMLLDKLKTYFKEIEIEKRQNEEFRSTLLESVNAQNTQILHLLSQLATHQKLIDSLQDELKSLKGKVNKCTACSGRSVNEPQWVPFDPSAPKEDSDGIALHDVKHILNQVRPQRVPVDTLSNAVMPLQPYTVQKYSRRSFLPAQAEQIAMPPQPQPKPPQNQSNCQNGNHTPRLSEPVVIHHPKIRVERYSQ